MKLESLRVELRPRSPWEAVELGTALVRRHAAAIWKPWLLLTVPVFAVVNLAAVAMDRMWLAWLAMWWLKPLFDRIPLFVLSRAVFGDTPTTRQTLAAQRGWGWRAMRQHLGWRRIGLTRALMLPIDLLEHTNRKHADPRGLRQRRRVLGDAIRGNVVLLTLICVLFIVALSLSALSLVLLFVPWEFLSESARAVWSLIASQPPWWAQIAVHAVVWGATSIIEPFYIGAGFGLYLDRRTRIEAWDVEIAFRRLRTRVASAATALLLVIGAASLLPMPASAQAQEQDSARIGGDAARIGNDEDAVEVTRLADIFGQQQVDDTTFRSAVERAFDDPLLRPQRTEMQWRLRNPRDDDNPDALPFPWLAKAIGFVGEFGLWLLFAALALVLALTAKRWWPWLRSGLDVPQPPAPVDIAAATLPDVLPGDIAASARALWREGRPRRALALLYRASVEAMVQRAGVLLAPGATESECLRASRRMPEAQDRDVFARIVRVWQYAAYAQRLPREDEFESLLGTLSQRFGWAP